MAKPKLSLKDISIPEKITRAGRSVAALNASGQCGWSDPVTKIAP